jgi:hypothetical protein
MGGRKMKGWMEEGVKFVELVRLCSAIDPTGGDNGTSADPLPTASGVGGAGGISDSRGGV